MHHEFTQDLADLGRRLIEADGRGDTAYHACASFNVGRSRKAADAGWLRSFFCDVDAGPGKPYGSLEDAIGATEDFRKATGLPPCLYVNSGAYGLHIYWPLDTDVPADVWLTYARGLKALCDKHGFKADPTRTADASSILRPLGTHNRKSGTPVMVQCGPDVGSYSLAAFASLLGGNGGTAQRVLPTSKQAPAGLIGQLAASLREQHSPSYAADIATKCKQIGALRDTKGKLTEPVWYSCLGVLAWCEDGNELAHEWSSGHPTYSRKETDKKLAQRRELDGATRCDWFLSNAPDGCKGCPHVGKINSPISLGYRDAQPSNPSTPKTDEPSNRSTPDSFADGTTKPFLPPNFEWYGEQLVARSESKNGMPVRTVISDVPLFLESIGTGEIETDTHSYNFRLILPRGSSVITLPARQFMGVEGIAHLFSRGAVVHEKDLFRKYTMSAIDNFNQTIQTPVVRFEQFGWKDNETAFLWGRSLYTPSNVMPAMAVDEVVTRGKLLNINRRGSIERWTAAANKLFMRDAEPHAFALMASFAAPLMRFHTTSEGGAILCLVGRKGTAKTTALDAAGSVWGEHRALDLNTFDTKISRGVNLGVLGNLPVIYDELEKQDAGVLKEFVAIFTAGRDRARATVDGGIRHEARTWQTIVIAAANRSVVELVSSADDSEALSTRVLELPGHLPEGMTDSEGTALRNELKLNHGHAADAYLRYLVQPEVLKWVRATLITKTDEVWKRTGLVAEHRFWVRMIGAAWVAGLLVERTGLLAFSPDRLIDWAIDYVAPLKQPDPVARAREKAVDALGEYLNEAFEFMVTVKGPWKPGARQEVLLKPPRRVIARCEMQPLRYYLAEKPFRTWLLKRGIPAEACITELRSADIVLRSKLVTLTAGTDMPPGGQVVALDINGRHPALTGVAVPLEVLQGSMEKQA